MGYMCARGWRRDDALNPARIPITIREYEHKSGWGIQEGRYSGDHVNIMGNVEMIEDVLEAVTGHAGEIRERTTSRVRGVVRGGAPAVEATVAVGRGGVVGRRTT